MGASVLKDADPLKEIVISPTITSALSEETLFKSLKELYVSNS
jgi:hypothetical protein